MDDVMKIPVCLTQYFVNKQNVRSFQNIFNTKLLRSDEQFINNIFNDNTQLTKELTSCIVSSLSRLRENINSKCKSDFRNYFLIEKSNNLQPVSKEEVLNSCWLALNDIIPRSLIGNCNNFKIFRTLVTEIIYGMRHQHIVLYSFIKKWDLSSDVSELVLYHLVLWIFKHILSPMICLNFYVTTCKLDGDENKLYYFYKNQWQSFYDRKVTELKFKKIIIKHEFSSGKKIKRKLSSDVCKNNKLLKKDIPKLHLVLKNNNEYRPIVRYRSGSQNPSEKYKMKERFNFLKTLSGKQPQKLESQFTQLHQKWIKLNKPKLYFVKTDLSNAFGSVSKDKLFKILCESHLYFQKKEQNVDIKKKMATQFKEVINELRKPILVRAGSTVYEWREGLVQGYKYSPALSELYYKHLDEIYFASHLKNSEDLKLFARVVDDYLYITDSLTDAKNFLTAINNYKNVNYSKTFINFEYENVKLSNEITFLGYKYNTDNLQVSRASNIYTGQMCYKIAFTGAISNVGKFLENRIGQSGIPVTAHLFNLHHNSEEVTWQHIFTTFCLSANKFCTILAIICDDNNINYLNLYKQKVVVKLGNAIIDCLLRNKPRDYRFIFCLNHIQYLSWKALYLCAGNTSKCNNLIPHLKKELARTDCLNGKWREHANMVDSNGESMRNAIKQICRRQDLRVIFKQFEVLPPGFDCFNNKKIFK